MEKISYKIYTLGCKVNQCDSRLISRQLGGFGWTPTEKNAQVAIVNSCAVTKTAIRKGKQTLSQARRENPGAKIILTGCWPRVYREEAGRFNVDLLWPKETESGLAPEIKKIFKPKSSDKDIESQAAPTAVQLEWSVQQLEKTRYFLKIQDGCNQFCSYCVIPFARGRLKSRNGLEALKEARQAVRSGCREIVLTGIHLGLYGREKDSPSKMGLEELAAKIISLPGLLRLRLSSIEINEVSDKLLELMRAEKKFCCHLHIPLQAGTDKILKLMNRPYDTEIFRKKIEHIRQVVPDIAISTDLIVGFPGESEIDFSDTTEFVRSLGFSRLHVFSFSAHEKTAAYRQPGKVSANEIKRRSRELRETGRELEEAYIANFRDAKLPVLAEEVKEGRIFGKTEYYFERSEPIPDKAPPLVGQILNI